MTLPEPSGPATGPAARWKRPAQVIVVSSVMFTFISYWRTAAVVLCDLASTAYYIGGIVEGAIGPAAPWFILGVMLFSYAVRSIYIESCSLFVRGGVYRVVKEAMGGFLAKLSVSALMFDYVLTGPTSGVSAGQYIMGLGVDTWALMFPSLAIDPETALNIRRWGSVVIACAITLYFYRANLFGLHESSDKALKIMIATTIMAVVMLAWCGVTLAVQGRAVNNVPLTPDLKPKVKYEVVTGKDRVTGEEREMWKRDEKTGELVHKKGPDGRDIPVINEATGQQEDPLGFISWLAPDFAKKLREPGNWLNIIGMIGIMLAFGHSILAMSGEETLAQVYREVESPKMKNFKKAAFIVFVYSLALTASISFLAVLIIPDEVRMFVYKDNLIGGLAMHVYAPVWARLLLNAFVVVIGFLILAGAVNTAIIGSNGVLNRVSEDGVLPDWFLKPHPKRGTTYRLLNLIVGLQLFTILVSRGNMYILGEAYAFGVVWSFVFKALAMVVLRFKDRSPRDFKVPLNFHVGGVEIPLGLITIFLILLTTAVLNFFTKEVATIGGVVFTAVFLVTFIVSEHVHEKRRGEAAHHHLEQFNQQRSDEVSIASLDLTRTYRKLVAIRSPNNLFMLEKTLADTDPETTDVVVMTAKVVPRGDLAAPTADLDHYDQELMTAVVGRAEKAGKHVTPLIMPTNNSLFAVIQTARQLDAQELVMGASNKYTADEQLEQIAFYWINVNDGRPVPLTVRIMNEERDVSLDLNGGNRIPKLGERRARSVADLRSAGIGVNQVLLIHFNNPQSSDLFVSVLTMLDPQIKLTLVAVFDPESAGAERNWLRQDIDQAKQLRRQVEIHELTANDPAAQVVQLAQQRRSDLIVIGLPSSHADDLKSVLDVEFVVQRASCPVCLVSPAAVPQEVAAK